MLVLYGNTAHPFIVRVFDMDNNFKDSRIMAYSDGLNLVKWYFSVFFVVKRIFAQKEKLRIRDHNYSFLLEIVAIVLLDVAWVEYKLVISSHQLAHLERGLLQIKSVVSLYTRHI